MARDARLLAGLAAALALCLGTAGAGSAASSSTDSLLIEHWDGAAWTQAPVAGEGELSVVAAVSAADVWALGTDREAAIAERWDGASWQQVPIPTPRGAAEIYLAGVAARSATDIWAVGSWAGSGGYRTLIEHWDGTAWKIVPGGARRTVSARLSGVTAVSAKDAWAVGEFVALNSPRRTLVLHWNGKTWKRVRSPNPSQANPRGSTQDDSLAAVDAVSARNMWAVGTYFRRVENGHHSYQTLVLHWNGKAWKRVPSPSPGGIRHVNMLDAVAARSADDAWAVGSYHSRTGQSRLLAEHWNGGSWKAVPMPPLRTPFAPEPGLTSVSPLAAGDVWASGSYLDDNGLVVQPLAAHWDGGTWSLSPTPMVGTSSLLQGIAAVSANDVWAVGGLVQH